MGYIHGLNAVGERIKKREEILKITSFIVLGPQQLHRGWEHLLVLQR